MKLTLVVFSLLCLGALGLGSYEASKHLGRQWRAVPAEFVRYETLYRHRKTRAAYPAIHYTYVVDGRTYSATDRSLTGQRYRDDADAKAAALALFDPARLIAYHDVATPDQSDLN
jgi:hypothetical protein